MGRRFSFEFILRSGIFSFMSSLQLLLRCIVGSYLTSIATISQSINTSSSEKNEDSSDRNALNATYMLHGLIGILCLLLIVMLIRLCKNSKFENVNVDDIQNECHFQKQPENRHSYDTIPESVAIVQTYGPLESVYDEIDDKIHVHNSISMKTLSDIYEKPGVSTGNPSRTLGTSDLLVPMNDFQREQNEKYSSLMSANMSESIDLEMNCFDKNGYTHAI